MQLGLITPDYTLHDDLESYYSVSKPALFTALYLKKQIWR